jgi:hypothetical protein
MSDRVPVVVEVTIKMVVDVPSDWRGEDLAHNTEFFLNDSSHCASNELLTLCERIEVHGNTCPCNQMQSKFLRVATPEDRDLYHYMEPE